MASPKRKISPNDIFDHPAPNAVEAAVIPMPAAEPQFERQPKQPALRVGEMLKRERERRGYDLQQIADYLCIRRGLLAAIENSKYDEFPADAYVIGFLRSYAELIGIDGQDAIEHYRQEMAGRRRKPDLIIPTPISEGRAPTAVIIGAAAFASLMIYILWYAFSSNDRATVTAPPSLQTATDTVAAMPGAETIAASTPSGIAIGEPAPTSKALTQNDAAPAASSSAPTPAAAAPAATPAASSSHAHISVHADQSSWVLVSNANGQTIYDHVMKPGESYDIPNLPGLTLTTGNGAGIVLSLDGTDLPRLSQTTSHIVRNVPLETNALKNLQTQ